MQYRFLNVFLDKKELLNQENNLINPILLENNATQLEQIYDFYKNESKILCANGFLGTGKAQIIDYSTSFLAKDTVVLKYNCFETTILDDVLLSFFSDFKKLFLQKLILEPKIKTENFTQKINSYFSSIEKPFLIVIDSFEAILKENRKEILDFIFHLTTFNKIKIILISRTFESSYFENTDTKYDRVTTMGLEKHLVEKYLKKEKIKISQTMLEEFQKHSRGYYFYVKLATLLMIEKEWALSDFINDFSTSFLPMNEYLGKKTIDFIPATSRNLFWFLSMVRHPVSLDLLKVLKLYDQEKIEHLAKYSLISQENSLIYVKDFFREQVDVSVAPAIAQKIHTYIVDLYQTQLPLKPLERNILISRQTMRNEIEYHSLFLPKKPKHIENIGFDVNYLTYAKGLDFDSDQPVKTKEEKETKKEQTEEKNSALIDGKTQTANLKINIKDLPFKLSPEEMKMLDVSEEQKPIENILVESTEAKDDQEITSKEEKLSFQEFIDKAKLAEQRFLFTDAINYYKKAIENSSAADLKVQQPIIYTKIANNYQKLSDWDNALKYFALTKEIYEHSAEKTKADYIKLSIAKILYETYKIDKAKEILKEIIQTPNNPAILTTKVYVLLANIEDSLSNLNQAYEYYKKAIEHSRADMDVETLSELYFKYALSLDDKNLSQDAIEYYQKCINSSEDYTVNKFLSSAYSNIATLYMEKHDPSFAAKNYLKAYEIDKKSRNYDGMYYSASKLASILQKKHPEEALKFFETALQSAQKLSDIFYIASAQLAIGDFYYDKKSNELALKNYFKAYELVKNEFSKDNLSKIQMRINDIKFRIGVEKFETLMKKFKEEM